MKSGKKRREEIKAKRKERDKRKALTEPGARPAARSLKTTPVNEGSLAPYKSYGVPAFVMRGYYEDVSFRCRGCGRDEIWTAAQQKWWYEVAKGYVYSAATLCRACRRKEQVRRAEARRVHLEGIARKKATRGR
jgi:Probable zinc-ribbon domain